MKPETPNHALQRTAPCVTAPASAAAFPPAMQVPRRPPQSLSLRSFGDPRFFCDGTLVDDLEIFRVVRILTTLALR